MHFRQFPLRLTREVERALTDLRLLHVGRVVPLVTGDDDVLAGFARRHELMAGAAAISVITSSHVGPSTFMRPCRSLSRNKFSPYKTSRPDFCQSSIG